MSSKVNGSVFGLFASGSSAANFAPVEINEKAFQWDGNLPLGNHIGPGQAWGALGWGAVQWNPSCMARFDGSWVIVKWGPLHVNTQTYTTETLHSTTQMCKRKHLSHTCMPPIWVVQYMVNGQLFLAPRLGPIFFQFHAVFWKIWPK